MRKDWNYNPDSGGYQAVIEVDGDEIWALCPYCLKRNLLITPGASISGQVIKCKGSGCHRYFEVNIEDNREPSESQ